MRFAAALVFCLALAAGASAAGTLLGNPVQANPSAFLGAGSSAAGGGAYAGFGAGPYGSNANPYGNGASVPGTGVMPGLTSRAFHPLAPPRSINALNMDKQRSLKHHWAVGLDSIPAAALAQPSGGMVAVPSALSVRWWATDKLALELLASGNYASAQAGRGELSPLVSSSPGNAVYAGGLGLRYTISQLSHDLLSQFVFKASGAQTAVAVSGWSGQATESTLAVFVGAGFEAFVPGWNWLSVEADAGVTGFSQSLTPQGGGGAQTVSGLGLGGNGLSPINVAVHAYF